MAGNLEEVGSRADPTLAAADEAIEQLSHSEPSRTYLGMSGLGHECERKLWFDFRWASPSRAPAATIRMWEDGHRTEALVAERLRAVEGLELHTVDPETRQQFAVQAPDNPHVRGHLDGALIGLLQAPKTWHVWECKTVGTNVWNKLQSLRSKLFDHKLLLEKWNPIYYAQAVLYMHLNNLTRHYMTVATAGGRDWLAFRTNENPEAAKAYLERGDRITLELSVVDDTEAVSRSPSFYLCKWCDHQDVCHGIGPALVNCRTCCHATPERSGEWTCALNAMEPDHPPEAIPVEVQRGGCRHHVYLPGMISPALTWQEGDPATNTQAYQLPGGRRIRNGTVPEGKSINGEPVFSSPELYAAVKNGALELLGDPMVAAAREQFDATVGEEHLPKEERLRTDVKSPYTEGSGLQKPFYTPDA